MTKFIKLTESHTNGSHIPIIINLDNVLNIKPSERSKDTHVQFKEKYVFVQESVDEIWLMLNIDNSKAPVIMTAEKALKYYQMKGTCP